MKNPDLSIGSFYTLDFKREADGSVFVHMWEPMGSLHSEIGQSTTLSREEVEALKEFVSGL